MFAATPAVCSRTRAPVIVNQLCWWLSVRRRLGRRRLGRRRLGRRRLGRRRLGKRRLSKGTMQTGLIFHRAQCLKVAILAVYYPQINF
jgi:hypothetical protein